jgi:hypothetical protein
VFKFNWYCVQCSRLLLKQKKNNNGCQNRFNSVECSAGKLWHSTQFRQVLREVKNPSFALRERLCVKFIYKTVTLNRRNKPPLLDIPRQEQNAATYMKGIRTWISTNPDKVGVAIARQLCLPWQRRREAQASKMKFSQSKLNLWDMPSSFLICEI